MGSPSNIVRSARWPTTRAPHFILWGRGVQSASATATTYPYWRQSRLHRGHCLHLEVDVLLASEVDDDLLDRATRERPRMLTAGAWRAHRPAPIDATTTAATHPQVSIRHIRSVPPARQRAVCSIEFEHEAEGVFDCAEFIKRDSPDELSEALVGDGRCLLDEYLGEFVGDGDGGPEDP